MDAPSGFYPGGNPASAGVANGPQYREAGPSAPAAPHVFVRPPQQAGGDPDVYFGLDEFRPASPPPIAQPIPVPAFQPVPPPAFQPVPPPAFPPVPPPAFPPPFVNLDPAPAHERRKYVPYMLGHLYEPAQHEWFDVFRNIPVVHDPRNGSPAYAAELAFYTAHLPTGQGFALNFLPETSPYFIHASEAAGWFTFEQT
ncbi:hypothetical protein DAEQUDRAFT_724535 [Daedalea quercina L-15889]|uniref:Uncharacterized protein n=1 Tax=Daedalea quercina L-15889 TaxID=1314783 RepID=A0A165RU70_9APHY|nr:hypothetical protein DAEQUDRAFT_724535 [Daedalea quercina L-15889]